MNIREYPQYCWLHPDKAYEKASQEKHSRIARAILEVSEHIHWGSYPIFVYENAFFKKIIEAKDFVIFYGFVKEKGLSFPNEFIAVWRPAFPPVKELQAALKIESFKVEVKKSKIFLEWDAVPHGLGKEKDRFTYIME